MNEFISVDSGAGVSGSLYNITKRVPDPLRTIHFPGPANRLHNGPTVGWEKSSEAGGT